MYIKAFFPANFWVSHRSYLVGILLLPLLWTACSQKPQATSSTPVILISIDTLRSDRLPVYGYKKVETPAIDRFAKDSLIFEHAFAQVPLTLPSHASMLTGKLPTTHGVRDNIAFFLPEEEMTLPEALKAEGYETGAVVSSMVMRKEVGLSQGFDFYEDRLNEKEEAFVRTFAQRDGSQSLPIALDWLDQRGDAPFFMMFHLYDPHVPYTPPEPFASRYKSAYDGEIAYTDSLLAPFFKKLKQKGFYDRALIILVSDHGEGLGDHEEMEHGMFVYREAIQVPLLVKLPFQDQAGTRITTPVGLMDLAPSIMATLDLAGWEGDGEVIFGKGKPPKQRPIYSESLFAKLHYGWHPQQSTVQQQWHYIRGGGDLLFDYQADPGETEDLFGKQRIPKPMLNLLDTVGTGTNSRTEISEEDLAMLSSLGYAGLTSPTADILALSASEIVRLKDAFNACHQLIGQGKKDEAQVKLGEILQNFPTMMDARVLLAVLLREQGAYEEIEHLLAEGLANAPNNIRILTYLAEAKLRLGDLPGAKQLATKAMGIDPDFAGEVLLPVFLEKGLKDEADALAGKLLDTSSNTQALYVKARKALEDQRFDDAVEAANKALEQEPLEKELKLRLLILQGEALSQTDQFSQARNPLEQALSLDPKATRSRIVLALVMDRLGDHQENITQLKEGLRYDENAVDLLLPLTLAQLKAGRIEEAQQTSAQALKQDPQATSPPLSFYFLKYGTPASAVTFAQKVLAVTPQSPYALFLMGWVAHAKRDFQPAIRDLNQAVEGAKQQRDPQLLSEAAFYLGDAYANLRKPREAAEALQLATQVRPDYPEAQVSLAAIYALAGREQDALAILKHWLDKYPTPENFQAAKSLLTKFGLNEIAGKLQPPP